MNFRIFLKAKSKSKKPATLGRAAYFSLILGDEVLIKNQAFPKSLKTAGEKEIYLRFLVEYAKDALKVKVQKQGYKKYLQDVKDEVLVPGSLELVPFKEYDQTRRGRKHKKIRTPHYSAKVKTRSKLYSKNLKYNVIRAKAPKSIEGRLMEDIQSVVHLKKPVVVKRGKTQKKAKLVYKILLPHAFSLFERAKKIKGRRGKFYMIVKIVYAHKRKKSVRYFSEPRVPITSNSDLKFLVETTVKNFLGGSKRLDNYMMIRSENFSKILGANIQIVYRTDFDELTDLPTERFTDAFRTPYQK